MDGVTTTASAPRRGERTRSARRSRLLWVNHFALTPDMGGGTRHVELGRELTTRGWDVRIAASDYHLHRRVYVRRDDPSSRTIVREQWEGVHIDWHWASAYERNDHHRLMNWLSFARSVAQLRPDPAPDIVIGSSPQLFAALAAWRVARRVGASFVLEVRDLWPESLMVGGTRKGPGYAGLWAVARLLYRVAEHIIVLADGSREYLIGQGIPASKITCIPNGVDAASFATAEAPARDRLRLVYAGAHGPANGLDQVLIAADALRDEPRVSFALVGDGPARPALRAEAERRRLTNVTFVDPIPKSEMPAFLAGCDAGLMVLRDLPLFAFGVSPNKLFDYWGAALPVLCNVPGEVARLVREADGGVQAADASGAALAAAARELLALSPDERRRLGIAGRSWVRRERDRPVVAERLDALLQPLASRRAR